MRIECRHPDHRKMSAPGRLCTILPPGFAALCFLALLTSTAALAQSSAKEDAARIIALEHAWNRAIEAKDTKALDQLLAPTFVAVDTDGSLTRKGEFLAGIKAPSYQPAEAFYEDIRAEVYGDTAVTVGIFRIREIQKGKRITQRQRFIDTWIRKGQTWQCVASQVTLMPAKQAQGPE
jgi:ketosteroid isomerase-like protein